MSLFALQSYADSLTDFTSSSEFSSVLEVSGPEVAVAYAIAGNCIEAIAEGNDDDWLMEVIRKAYAAMSAESQAKFAEQGF